MESGAELVNNRGSVSAGILDTMDSDLMGSVQEIPIWRVVIIREIGDNWNKF